MVPILSLCSAAKSMRSGSRAMPPSSRMISHSTAAGESPARRARSQQASVCPARTSTPPGCAISGNTWPGWTMSSGLASGAAATLMVSARSCAEMPVEIPSAASIEVVQLVPWRAQLIELDAANVALARHLDRGNQRRVGLERALDALARRYLAHDERGIQSAVALGDHHAFERLQPLSLALDDVDVHHHGVARGEIRHLAAQPLDLFLLECLNQIHVSSCTLSGTPPAASFPLRSAASPPAGRAA